MGSLANAVPVVSRLHRGEKRLVFIDSRAMAERLGQDLRQLGVTAFVTHSSLSQGQRNQGVEAFAHRDDCVIVATRVLELGVDLGGLDRVIQVDSPATVSWVDGGRGRRLRESRPVPIEVDNPFRIGSVWGRKPQVSTCGGYLGLG